MKKANQELQNRLNRGELPANLANWVSARASALTMDQALPLLFLIFQDDLLEIAAGPEAQPIIEKVEKEVIREELGVNLSPKPAANLPFSTKFESIGAEFDMTNADDPICRTASHVLNECKENCG